jgi:hypothetical protein
LMSNLGNARERSSLNLGNARERSSLNLGNARERSSLNLGNARERSPTTTAGERAGPVDWLTLLQALGAARRPT